MSSGLSKLNASTGVGSDRLSRSWAFRESDTKSQGASLMLPAKRNIPASSSVTLPVCLPKDSPAALVRTSSEGFARLEQVKAEPVAESVASTPSAPPPAMAEEKACPIVACFDSAPAPVSLECQIANLDPGVAGVKLFRAALGLTNSNQADAYPAQIIVLCDPIVAVESLSPLAPATIEVDTGRKVEAPVPKSQLCPNVEENQDPNIAAGAGNGKDEKDVDVIAFKPKPPPSGKAPLGISKVQSNGEVSIQKVKPPPTIKGPPAQRNSDAFQIRASSAVVPSTTPRMPPNSWHDKSGITIEESWIRLDGLRVRMEMLPGGLVIERDTNLSELSVLMAEVQNGDAEPSERLTVSAAHMRLTEMNHKLTVLTELGEAVESEYWQWCTDADAAPLDMVAKQQVYDWLVHTGEKTVVLVQLRELGARRCLGTCCRSSPQRGDEIIPCRRFLQYGLYKSKVRRCPMCSKESKKLVAHGATEAVRTSLVDGRLGRSEVQLADEADEAVPKRKCSFDEAPPSSVAVEGRELCWALYAACPDTYFRAYVVPYDLAIGKENATAVNVSWLDGDRRHRSVPTADIIMADDPIASDLKFANAGAWDKDGLRLVARTVTK